ncbi:hypothetical protein SK128_024253, partial [Halocaridina rubra]
MLYPAVISRMALRVKNTTISIKNETVISDNIADNPHQKFYQTVYACLIIVILGTSLLRGFAFMK